MRLRIGSCCSVVDRNHLGAFLVWSFEIVFFLFEVTVVVGNTVEELLDEDGLHDHVDHKHEDEEFSCNVLIEPLIATSGAGKISTFVNEDFAEKDYENLDHRQNHSEAVVRPHLILEDQTQLVMVAVLSFLHQRGFLVICLR